MVQCPSPPAPRHPPIRPEHLTHSVMEYARFDFPVLTGGLSVEQALARIREHGLGERIVYFYVVDELDRMVGVIPTRRLLIAPLGARVRDIMIASVIHLPISATVADAAAAFARHKFLALPVLDDAGRIFGVVDIEPFAGELGNVNERTGFDDVYAVVGVHVAEAQGAGPLRSFRLRFPWLLATIASGTAAALIAGLYQATLEQAIVLAFFLTLVLGLSESVSMQSMTLALGALHAAQLTWRSFLDGLRRELLTAGLLGAASGACVGLIAWLWKGLAPEAWIIGSSIALSMFTACLIGLLVPTVLHVLKRDARIAAGPITLAATDLCTLLYYFNVARVVLAA